MRITFPGKQNVNRTNPCSCYSKLDLGLLTIKTNKRKNLTLKTKRFCSKQGKESMLFDYEMRKMEYRYLGFKPKKFNE